MAVTSTLTEDDKKLTLAIKGRFDFVQHQDFRSAYEQQDSKPDQFVVDLKDTTYVDSSALGMLLMLRDKAKASGRAVTLANCRGAVKQVLDIANFGKLFAIV